MPYYYILFIYILENMIRSKLKELIVEKQFQDGRRITLDEVVSATGISLNDIVKGGQPIGLPCDGRSRG